MSRPITTATLLANYGRAKAAHERAVKAYDKVQAAATTLDITTEKLEEAQQALSDAGVTVNFE